MNIYAVIVGCIAGLVLSLIALAPLFFSRGDLEKINEHDDMSDEEKYGPLK